MSVTTIVSFRDLEVWQAAMDLAVTAHGLATALPPLHRFELGSQIRRAANSVPSNIAEGHGNKGTRVYLQHVRIAIGSLAELDTLVELMLRLALTSESQIGPVRTHVARTGQLLHGLQRALRRRVAAATASVLSTVISAAIGAWWIGVL